MQKNRRAVKCGVLPSRVHPHTALLINESERGVYAASSFRSPHVNCFVYARSDTEAA